MGSSSNHPTLWGNEIHKEDTFRRELEGGSGHLAIVDSAYRGTCPIYIPIPGRLPPTADHQVDQLGFTPLQRSIAASELIQALLIQPVEHQNFLTTIAKRNQIEHYQMRLFFIERP